MSNFPPPPSNPNPGGMPAGPPPGPPQPGWGPPPPGPAQPGWTPPGGNQQGAWGTPNLVPTVKEPASAAAKTAGWVIAGTALVVVIGSVLPWLSLSGPDAEAIERQMEAQGEGVGGLDKDGVLTIVLGLVALLMGVLRGTGRAVKGAAITGIVMGALVTLIGIVDILDVADVADEVAGFVRVDVSAGIGLWLTLLGGIAVLASSIWALRRT